MDDWEAWLQEASGQRLSSVVWASLKDMGLQSIIPGKVHDELEARWRQAVAANALVHMEVSVISSRLDTEQLPWILLKGPSAADILYSDPGARPMSDIDILIKMNDLDRCLRLLAEDGWKLREDMHPRYVRITHAVALKTEPLLSMLEIHHNLLGTAPLACEHLLWDSSEKASIGGRRVSILGAADRALHLGVHAVLHHGLKSAAQLLDVVLACSRLGPEDWQKLVGHAKKLGLVEEMYYALEAARLRQDYSAPDEPARALEAARPGWLRRKAASLALEDAGGHAGMTISRLVMTHGWGNRWRYLKFVLLPPREWLGRLESSGAPPAAYTRRALRGLGAALRQLLSKGPAADIERKSNPRT